MLGPLVMEDIDLWESWRQKN